MKRATYLALLSAVVLAACGQAAAPVKSGTLRYSENFNLDVRDVPTLMALDDLASQSYIVERVDLASSGLVGDALARGDVDMAAANTQTIWTAIAEGADVRTIAQKFGSTLTLETREEIQTCADLDGAAIGTAGAKSLNTSLFYAYIDQTCPGTEPQLVVIAENDGRLAALLAGELDGSLMQSEDVVLAENKAPGRFHQLVRLYEVFESIVNQGVYVRRDFAKQNPDLVKDYLRALLRAHREVIAHPDTLYKQAADRLELDATEAQVIGQAYLAVNYWNGNGGLTEERVQATLDLLQGLDLVPSSLTAADVADLSYLNAVLDEMGRQ